MARKTEWQERADGSSAGLGQRLLATDEGDHPILEVRSIELEPAPEPGGVTAAAHG
jgi:type VI secretion system protein ImpE